MASSSGTGHDTARVVSGCRYPERCGSDGKACCHYECWFSIDQQMQREHIKSLTTKEANRRAR